MIDFCLIFSVHRPTLGCNAATELNMHTHLGSLNSSPTHPLIVPSMDRPGGGALALHYASARGCLDCVRLLVEASPEIRLVVTFIDCELKRRYSNLFGRVVNRLNEETSLSKHL